MPTFFPSILGRSAMFGWVNNPRGRGSDFGTIPDTARLIPHGGLAPCVDGSPLARAFLDASARLVGAAMCSTC